MNDPIVVTRNLVKRGWTDFEPKVITGLMSGSVAAFLVTLVANYGIHLTTMQENYIVVGCYFLGSYLTPSSGTTVTRRIEDAAQKTFREVESHTGATVSVVTAPTRIQKAASSSFADPDRGSVTSIVNGNTIAPEPDPNIPGQTRPDDGATQVMPSTADRFLAARAAARPAAGPPAAAPVGDDH